MSATAQTSRSVVVPVIAIGACLAALLIGGALTRPNLDWSATLAKPSFAPSNRIFPVVWPILYALMAISAWLAWRAPGKEEDRKLAMIWFFIPLAIGVLWSVAFFVMHSPAGARFRHLVAEPGRYPRTAEHGPIGLDGLGTPCDSPGRGRLREIPGWQSGRQCQGQALS